MQCWLVTYFCKAEFFCAQQDFVLRGLMKLSPGRTIHVRSLAITILPLTQIQPNSDFPMVRGTSMIEKPTFFHIIFILQIMLRRKCMTVQCVQICIIFFVAPVSYLRGKPANSSTITSNTNLYAKTTLIPPNLGRARGCCHESYQALKLSYLL